MIRFFEYLFGSLALFGMLIAAVVAFVYFVEEKLND